MDRFNSLRLYIRCNTLTQDLFMDLCWWSPRLLSKSCLLFKITDNVSSASVFSVGELLLSSFSNVLFGASLIRRWILRGNDLAFKYDIISNVFPFCSKYFPRILRTLFEWYSRVAVGADVALLYNLTLFLSGLLGVEIFLGTTKDEEDVFAMFDMWILALGKLLFRSCFVWSLEWFLGQGAVLERCLIILQQTVFPRERPKQLKILKVDSLWFSVRRSFVIYGRLNLHDMLFLCMKTWKFLQVSEITVSYIHLALTQY